MTAAQARELAITPRDMPILNEDEAHIFNMQIVKIRKAAMEELTNIECFPQCNDNKNLRMTFLKMGYNFAINSSRKPILIW